jgi:hypothetical protein
VALNLSLSSDLKFNFHNSVTLQTIMNGYTHYAKEPKSSKAVFAGVGNLMVFEVDVVDP